MRTQGRLHQAMVYTMLGTSALSACTSWQVQTIAPEAVVTTQHPKTGRVQRLDGSRVGVNRPTISSDSLVGAAVDNSFLGTKGSGLTGIPLADIHQIDVKRGSAGKTVGLILGIAAVAVVGFYVFLLVECGVENCM